MRQYIHFIIVNNKILFLKYIFRYYFKNFSHNNGNISFNISEIKQKNHTSYFNFIFSQKIETSL